MHYNKRRHQDYLSVLGWVSETDMQESEENLCSSMSIYFSDNRFYDEKSMPKQL